MKEPFDEYGSSLETLMGRVADEFLREQSDGKCPKVEEYVSRYPQAAELLRQVLTSLQWLDNSLMAEQPDNDRSGSSESKVLGDFRIVREIGRGGMGVVFEAEQVSLGRRVALKILPMASALDSRRLQRFKNESRAAAGLHHSSIIPIYAIGCDHNVHYYAMQFIDGKTLAEVLCDLRRQAGFRDESARQLPVLNESRASIDSLRHYQENSSVSTGSATVERNLESDASDHPEYAALLHAITNFERTLAQGSDSTARRKAGRDYCRSIASLGIHAAEALDYAHQHGIVHRDIKPANIMLDADGKLWVADFGVARIETDVGMTLSGDVMGTLRYMSPEQILAKRGVVDQRSDIYSLGATLYELLTLRPVFEGEDRHELLRQIAHDDPRAQRNLNPVLAAELETIVLKALQKNPVDRYSTSAALAEDLRRFLDDRPILAKPSTRLQRTCKWFRRHKSLSAGIAGAAVVLLFASAASAILFAASTRDTAKRQMATNRQIAESLAQAMRINAQAQLQGANEIAREQTRQFASQATTLAASELADPLLAKQARELAEMLELDGRDRQLLSKLDEAWMQSTVVDPRDGQFQNRKVLPLLVAAFDEWGITTGKTRVREAVDLIQRRPTKFQANLVAAFDRWSAANKRRQTPVSKEEDGWLNEIVDLLDTDLWRRQRRDATRRLDTAALIALSRSAPVASQPIETLMLLGEKLCSRQEEFEEGLALLQRAETYGPDDFWIHYTLFNTLNRAQPPQYEEALRHASMAVALRPRVPAVYVILGVALERVHRISDAIQANQRAIELDPNYADAHNNLGALLRMEGDLEGAAAAYRAAISAYPEFAEAHNNLGIILGFQSHIPAAIAAYRRAIEIRPNYVNAMIHLGMTLRGNGDLAEAIATYRSAVAVAPRSTRAFMELGIALAEGGELREAEAAMRSAVAISPDDADALQNLGTLLMDGEASGEGRTLLERAIAIDPKLVNAHFNLGLHFLKENDLERSLVEFQRTIELEPNQAEAYCNLASVFEKQGQLTSALASYQHAFKISPEVAANVSLAHRYNAACAAALAGCEPNGTVPGLEESVRRTLRDQARGWLLEDLEYWRTQIQSNRVEDARQAVETLEHWQRDRDLAGIREVEQLAQLADDERVSWEQLWDQIKSLVALVNETDYGK